MQVGLGAGDAGLLAGRRQLKDKLHDVELSLRGLLRNFGLKLGEVSAKTYESRVRALTEGHPVLAALAEAMLRARTALTQFAALHRQVLAAARASERAKLLMTAPGVGAVIAPVRHRGTITRGARHGDRPEVDASRLT